MDGVNPDPGGASPDQTFKKNLITDPTFNKKSDTDPTFERKTGNGSDLTPPNKIHPQLFSFDIQVNIIVILSG